MPPTARKTTAPKKTAPVKPTETVELPAPGADPTPEELEMSARFGITVDGLRELRGQLDGAIRAEVRAQEDSGLQPASPVCSICLPDGWPEGGDHADCPHGTWKR